MLWFLSIAAGRGLRVDRYVDEARGTLGKDAEGRLVMTTVTLRPQVRFIGERMPDAGEIAAMHHQAHERCFLASSVKTAVSVEPRD
jgi:organic hydroperoxide reductase OsmC/OhrA